MIEMLGISAEEYQFFRQEIYRKGFEEREAAYGNIPDIQNGFVATVVVTLVVGTLFTVAAAALTPKPKPPPAPKFKQQKQSSSGSVTLDSASGTSRFNPTFGFQSLSDLASYGEVVPLVFGAYKSGNAFKETPLGPSRTFVTEDDGPSPTWSGGSLISPKLVWSRVLSYGHTQVLYSLYVAGCPELSQPELTSIWLGQSPLDTVYENDYNVFWNSRGGEVCRIQGENLIYGERGTPGSVDERTEQHVYTGPNGTEAPDTEQIFSMAYSPAAQTTFGVYSPILNGADRRLNWRQISRPKDTEDEQDDRNKAERQKIWGPANPKRTAGRGWSRFMGLVEIDGRKETNSARNIEGVNEQSKAKFVILSNLYTTAFGSDVNSLDINNVSKEDREGADDQLQLGDEVQIGSTIWRVTNRKIPIFRVDEQTADGGALSPLVYEGVEEDCDRRNDKLGGNRAPGCRTINGVNVFNPGDSPEDSREHWFFADQPVYVKTDDYTSFDYGKDGDVARRSVKKTVEYPKGSGQFFEFRFRAGKPRIQTQENWDFDDDDEYGKPAVYDIEVKTADGSLWVPLSPDGTIAGRQEIELTNEEIVLSNDIGIVNEEWLKQDTPNDGTQIDRTNHIPTWWTPLLRTNMAVVRNSRETSATEIGIRSNVWAQMNGLCNFNSLPTPDQQKKYDEKNVIVNNGFYNLYFTRFSFFVVQVRRSGEPNQTWGVIPKLFCVRGSRPTDQYNYIRFYTGFKQKLEYRLVPIPGTEVARYHHPIFRGSLPAYFKEAWMLAGPARVGQQKETVNAFTFGEITVQTNAQVVQTENILHSPLMDGQSIVTQECKKETVEVSCPDGGGGGGGGGTQCFYENDDGELRVGVKVYYYNAGCGPSFPPFGRGVICREYYTPNGWFTSCKQGTFFPEPDPDWDGDTKGWSVGAQQTGNGAPNGSEDTCGQSWHEICRNENDPEEEECKVFDPVFGCLDRSTPEEVEIARLAAADGETDWGDHEGPPLSPIATPFSEISGPDSEGKCYKQEEVCRDNAAVPWYQWEVVTQVTEGTYYDGLITRSSDSAPEHEVMYVNESLAVPENIPYTNMTMMGLNIRATRKFGSMDQPRVWVANGIAIPEVATSSGTGGNIRYGTIKPSNNFVDVACWLLTNSEYGYGDIVKNELVDWEWMRASAKFVAAKGFTFDGPLTNRVNLRDWIAQQAPIYMLNFAVSNGMFALRPAVPVDKATGVETKVAYSGVFTDSNILDDTLKVSWIDEEERKPFKALMRYRVSEKNQLPVDRTVMVYYSDEIGNVPIEEFDLTDYVTTKNHAIQIGRYFLALRRRVTSRIEFETTPEMMRNVEPGDFILVFSRTNPNLPSRTGVIQSDGTVRMSGPRLGPGQYYAHIWDVGEPEVRSAVVYVDGFGRVIEEACGNGCSKGSILAIYGAAYSTCDLYNNTEDAAQTYQVDQIEIDDEGVVTVNASIYPVTRGASFGGCGIQVVGDTETYSESLYQTDHQGLADIDSFVSLEGNEQLNELVDNNGAVGYSIIGADAGGEIETGLGSLAEGDYQIQAPYEYLLGTWFKDWEGAISNIPNLQNSYWADIQFSLSSRPFYGCAQTIPGVELYPCVYYTSGQAERKTQDLEDQYPFWYEVPQVNKFGEIYKDYEIQPFTPNGNIVGNYNLNANVAMTASAPAGVLAYRMYYFYRNQAGRLLHFRSGAELGSTHPAFPVYTYDSTYSRPDPIYNFIMNSARKCGYSIGPEDENCANRFAEIPDFNANKPVPVGYNCTASQKMVAHPYIEGYPEQPWWEEYVVQNTTKPRNISWPNIDIYTNCSQNMRDFGRLMMIRYFKYARFDEIPTTIDQEVEYDRRTPNAVATFETDYEDWFEDMEYEGSWFRNLNNDRTVIQWDVISHFKIFSREEWYQYWYGESTPYYYELLDESNAFKAWEWCAAYAGATFGGLNAGNNEFGSFVARENKLLSYAQFGDPRYMSETAHKWLVEVGENGNPNDTVIDEDGNEVNFLSRFRLPLACEVRNDFIAPVGILQWSPICRAVVNNIDTNDVSNGYVEWHMERCYKRGSGQGKPDELREEPMDPGLNNIDDFNFHLLGHPIFSEGGLSSESFIYHDPNIETPFKTPFDENEPDLDKIGIYIRGGSYGYTKNLSQVDDIVWIKNVFGQSFNPDSELNLDDVGGYPGCYGFTDYPNATFRKTRIGPGTRIVMNEDGYCTLLLGEWVENKRTKKKEWVQDKDPFKNLDKYKKWRTAALQKHKNLGIATRGDGVDTPPSLDNESIFWNYLDGEQALFITSVKSIPKVDRPTKDSEGWSDTTWAEPGEYRLQNRGNTELIYTFEQANLEETIDRDDLSRFDRQVGVTKYQYDNDPSIRFPHERDRGVARWLMAWGIHIHKKLGLAETLSTQHGALKLAELEQKNFGLTSATLEPTPSPRNSGISYEEGYWDPYYGSYNSDVYPSFWENDPAYQERVQSLIFDLYNSGAPGDRPQISESTWYPRPIQIWYARLYNPQFRILSPDEYASKS